MRSPRTALERARRIIARVSGTGSLTALTLGRMTNPANDNEEMQVDFQNASGTVMARIASHRANATAWGFKLYSSAAGALNNFPAFWIDTNGNISLFAAGSASINLLNLRRVTDPANVDDETQVHFQNAAGAVLARIAAYRINGTDWGLKLYSSVFGTINTFPAIGIDQLGQVVLRAASSATIVPLTLRRVTDPATNGDETQINFQNAAGTVMARLAVYLAASGQWGLKFYGSNGGAIFGTPSITAGAEGVTLRGGTVFNPPTLGVGPAILSTGQLLMTNNASITASPLAGSPLANSLYANNVEKAWGYVSASGTLLAGFNVSSVTKSGTGLYQVNFTVPFASANYAVIVTQASQAQACIQAGPVSASQAFMNFRQTGPVTLLDTDFSFTAYGLQ